MATLSPPPRVSEHAAVAFLGDDALAGLVEAGDRRAFEVIFERHRGEVFRYCSALVRDPHDAEEALQLAMVAAYRALARGSRPRIGLRPWLLRIAHNEAMDLMRSRPRMEELTDREDPIAERVHERAELRERMRELHEDIACLPVRQRAALVLREVNGLSHAAVGEALGTDAADARHLLHQARVSLAEFGLGRDLECRDVRARIADGDRRTLRARAVRAHLRACDGCRTFATAQDERRRRLASWFPVLPAAAAEGFLRDLLGGGAAKAGVAGAGAGGAAASLGGAAGGTLGALAAGGLGGATLGGVAVTGVLAVGMVAGVGSVVGVAPPAGAEAGGAAPAPRTAAPAASHAQAVRLAAHLPEPAIATMTIGDAPDSQRPARRIVVSGPTLTPGSGASPASPASASPAAQAPPAAPTPAGAPPPGATSPAAPDAPDAAPRPPEGGAPPGHARRARSGPPATTGAAAAHPPVPDQAPAAPAARAREPGERPDDEDAGATVPRPVPPADAPGPPAHAAVPDSAPPTAEPATTTAAPVEPPSSAPADAAGPPAASAV